MKNTPEIKALEWLKKVHPRLYAGMVIKRPDIIRAAYAKPLNGLSSVDGIFDDILGFAKEALPMYQQQKVFSAQLKQAKQGVSPAPAPIPVQPVFDAPTERAIDKKVSSFNPWLIGGAIAAIGGILFFFSRKKGR